MSISWKWAVLAALLAGCPQIARATTYTWIGGASTDPLDFNNVFKPGNWSPAGTPGAGDTAVFNAGAASNSPRTYIVTGNSTFNSFIIHNDSLGWQAVSNSDNLSLNLTGASVIGQNSGDNASFSMFTGALNTNTLTLGQLAGSSGSLSVTSSGTNPGNLTVGDQGSGSLSIGGGNYSVGGTLYVARNAGSSGSVSLFTTSPMTTQSLFVGGSETGAGGSGIVSIAPISSGFTTVASQLNVTSQATVRSGGSINNGGIFTAPTLTLDAAAPGKSAGKLDVNNGVAAATVTTLNDNGVVNVSAGNLTMTTLNGSGAFNLSGGLAKVTTFNLTGPFNWTGGTLELAGNFDLGTTTFLPAAATLGGTQHLIVDGTFYVADQPHTASLAVTNGARLTTGTVVLGGNDYFDGVARSGSVTIGNNAQWTVNGGVNIAGYPPNTALVQVNAGGTVVASGDLSVNYGGTFRQAGGGVTVRNFFQQTGGNFQWDDGTLTVKGTFSPQISGGFYSLAGSAGGAPHLVLDGGSTDLSSAFLIVGNNTAAAIDVRNGATFKTANAIVGGGGTSGNATATLTGAGSSWTAVGSTFTVGAASATGAMTVSNGATLNTTETWMSTVSSSHATFTLTDAGTTWNSSGPITVGGISAGDGGPAAFNVQNGATLNLGDTLYVQKLGVLNFSGGTINLPSLDLYNAPSRLNWTGGTFNFTGGIVVDTGGPFGASATFSAGTLATPLNLTVGDANSGVLTLGGTSRATFTNGMIARAANSTGAFVINNGGSATASGSFYDGGSPGGAGGTGDLRINTGGSLTVAGALQLLGSSSFELSGGSLTAGSVSASAASHFTWTGGNISLTNSDAIVGGGSIFASGSAIGAGQSLSTNGTFVVARSGTATFSINAGAALSATAIAVGDQAGAVGTLNLSGPNSLNFGASLLTVGNAGTGTLNVNANAAMTAGVVQVGASAGSLGTINVSGAGASLTAGGGVGVGGTPSAAGGAGAVNVTGGGTLAANAGIKVYSGGKVNLAGGSITTNALDLQSAPGRLNWTGGTLTLNVPQALLDTTSSLGPTFVTPTGGTLNTATLSVGSTGGSSAVLFENHGTANATTLNANRGTTRLFAGSTLNLATLNLGPGANLDGQNSATVNVTGNAALAGGSAASVGTGGNLTVGGQLAVGNPTAATSLTINGTVNTKYLFVDQPGANPGVVTVSGSGASVNVSSRFDATGNFGGAIIADAHGGNLAITNGGSFSAGFVQVGKQSGATGSLTVSGAGSTVTTESVLAVGDGSTFSVTGGATANLLGETARASTVNVDGAGSRLISLFDATIGTSAGGLMTVSNGGTAQIAGILTINNASNLALDGGTIAAAVLSNTTFRSNNLAAPFHVTGGTLRLTQSRSSLVVGDTGRLVALATDTDPHQTGYQIAEVQGTFAESTGATLDLRLVYTGAQVLTALTLDSSAQFAGTLDLAWDSTLAAAVHRTGDTYQVFDYRGAHTGTFDEVNLPALPSGLGWDTSALYSTGAISVGAVPEPSALAMLAVGTIGTLRRRHRRLAAAE